MVIITLSDPKRHFYLSNGRGLKSLAELGALAGSLPDAVFSHHVNGERNDFASWINDVFAEHALANAVRRAKTQKQLSEILSRFLSKGHFVHEVVIIGGGIAGMSAALYASRQRMDYVLISPDFGGQMNVSGEIENYPGIAKTNWQDFQARFREQMKVNEIEMIDETVASITKLKDGHFVVATDKHRYETQTVVICTGARPRRLNVPGEKEYEKKGVTYCSICDGPLFKGKAVAIIGGGDAALESASSMLRIASKIYLITINPKLTGQEYLLERVRGQPHVEVVTNAKTLQILGDKFVTGVIVDTKGARKTLPVQGVIVDIGRIPNTEMFKGLCTLNEHGHIVVNKEQATSVPGIFAAGDCTDSHEYQYAISAGEAVKALLKAVRFIERH